MTAAEFAQALRRVVSDAEDDGLERPAMIAALIAQAEADRASPAPEASPDGFGEAVSQLVADAEAAGLDRAELGDMLRDQAAAMCEAEAE